MHPVTVYIIFCLKIASTDMAFQVLSVQQLNHISVIAAQNHPRMKFHVVAFEIRLIANK